LALVSAQRFLVAAPVHEEFARKLGEAAAALVVGDGLEGPTDQGPLITVAALAKVEAHVADAVGPARCSPPRHPMRFDPSATPSNAISSSLLGLMGML